MTLFDRYVIGLFVKIMLVCYGSLAGLYLIIDGFTHLDDFVQLGRRSGSTVQFLATYYGPRLLGLFCEVSGLLYLLAAICTLTRLQGTHELAAVQAAGISVRRVARPMLWLSAALCLGTLAAREFVLPQFRQTLLVDSQVLLREEPQPVISQIDYDSLIVFRGKTIDPVSGRIEEPDLLLPHDWQLRNGKPLAASPQAAGLAASSPPLAEGLGDQIVARQAIWLPAEAARPEGFLLQQVHLPGQIGQLPSVIHQGKTRLYLPGDQTWLEADQCFVPTPITTWQMAFGVDWFRSASLSELLHVNQSGSVRLPSVHRVEIHWRVVRPVLDFLILLIGLPLVLRRGGQKLVIAAGYCALLMLAVQLLVMACHFLGGQQILKPAALAAWLPVLLAAPVAVYAYQRFDY